MSVGEIPVRITVLPADDRKDRLVGFTMYEQVGIGVYNPNIAGFTFEIAENCVWIEEELIEVDG